MANISNKLKVLFHAYLNRLEREKRDSYNYRPPSYGRQQSFNFADEYDFQGIIYFYEWSTVNRTPKTYYTLKAFENFLDRSGIYLAAYQKELIRNIHNPYIACKKGTKELIIKVSYESLKEALGEVNPKNPFGSTGAPSFIPPTNKGSEDKEPYSVAITRPPQGVKVLSCGVYPPNLPKSLTTPRPPMYAGVESRWPEMEQVGDWFG